MNSKSLATRTPLMIGVATLALALASSGCGWIKNKTNYQASREGSPLEVPPDLDRPDTSAATSLPVASTAGAPPSVASTSRLAMSAADAYPKVGEALAAIPGVVVNGRAEALSSYDVTYKGESFLVRVLDATGGSRLVALSPDGRMLNTGAPAELMAAIKARL